MTTPIEGTTPRPWFAEERDPDPSEPREPIVSVYGPDGDGFIQVSWMAGTDNDPFADAALIVEAVNSYDRLRAIEDAARDVMLQRAERRAGGGLVLTSRIAMDRLEGLLR